MLKTTHNAGFFSCCSVKLNDIVIFVNKNGKFPDSVDSSEQYAWYKNDPKRDVTFDYFEHYDNVTDVVTSGTISYRHNHQYKHYSDIDYKGLTPLIKKYFTPSAQVNGLISDIESKNNLNYENICVLFYRGNDKNKEIAKCEYEEYLTYSDKILEENPEVKFLIQSDETEFIEFMTKKYPNNSFYFKDDIRHMSKCSSTVDKVMKDKNYEFSKKYLAITIIMSRCKYIICGTGNCDIWIMLYRGNNKNTFQNNKKLETPWCIG